MKTRIFILLVLFVSAFCTGIKAQTSNIVVFAPGGEKFTLFIGSTMQNAQPAARVEAENPGGPTFKLRIVFPDPSIREISKLVFNKPHSTMFYKVGKNPKGVYALESVTSEWTDEGVVKESSSTPPPPPPAENKSKSETQPEKGDAAKSTTVKGCENPISDADFNGQVVGISARPFESIQLSAAKTMAETHCLRVSQVKVVMYIFNMESSRLSFAKFAYDHTYDRDNYPEVKEALHSQKSKDELDKYVSGKTR